MSSSTETERIIEDIDSEIAAWRDYPLMSYEVTTVRHRTIVALQNGGKPHSIKMEILKELKHSSMPKEEVMKMKAMMRPIKINGDPIPVAIAKISDETKKHKAPARTNNRSVKLTERQQELLPLAANGDTIYEKGSPERIEILEVRAIKEWDIYHPNDK